VTKIFKTLLSIIFSAPSVAYCTSLPQLHCKGMKADFLKNCTGLQLLRKSAFIVGSCRPICRSVDVKKTKAFQLQGASPPDPTMGSAPGPSWGLRSETPVMTIFNSPRMVAKTYTTEIN